MEYLNSRACSAALLAVLSATATAACGNSLEPMRSTPMRLEAVTPPHVIGIVGTTLVPAPAVRVLDGRGHPMPGVEVTFTMFDRGEVARASAMTEANGVASAEWRMGTRSGTRTAIAQAPGVTNVMFSAIAMAGPVAKVYRRVGNEQLGFPGLSVNPLSVTAVDSYENPVANATAHFTVANGGGSIGREPTVTDREGVATSSRWILGQAGPNVAVAKISGIESEPFAATALIGGMGGADATFVLKSVDGQSADKRALSGYVTLRSDGHFIAESTFDCCDGKAKTYRGAGRYGAAGGTILFHVQEGDWLAWAAENPASGNRLVHGSMVNEQLALIWFVSGPDHDTVWLYQRK